MSKYLEIFSKDVLKIIDTQDIFTDRDKKFEKRGSKNLFFSLTKNEEAKALNRADTIVSIQKEEEKFFKKISKNKKVITIGHILTQKEKVKIKDRKNILFVGSATKTNEEGIKKFIKEIYPQVKKSIPRCNLIIAGNVCSKIKKIKDIKLLGELKELRVAYNKGDVIINPIYVGTGLKIKIIEGLSYNKPIVSTVYGSKGIGKLKECIVSVNSNKDFKLNLIKLLKNKKERLNLCKKIDAITKKYNEENKKKIREMIS